MAQPRHRPARRAARVVKLSPIQNGLEFLRTACEFLGGHPDDRRLKYATLCLSAGIEILLKERLRREHWTLIFEKPEGATRAALQSGDFKSVGLDSSLNRLRDICGLSLPAGFSGDMSALRKVRNKIEHFGVHEPALRIKSLAAKALTHALDFLKTQFKKERLDARSRGFLAEINHATGLFSAFVLGRWKSVKAALAATPKPHLVCPECRQRAAVLKDGLTCLFCDYTAPPEEAATYYAREVVGFDPSDGDSAPLHECPDCESMTLVDCGAVARRAGQKRFVCFECGQQWETHEMESCMTCGKLMEFEEDSVGMCDDCMGHQMEKDD